MSTGGIVSIDRVPFTEHKLGHVAHDQLIPVLASLSIQFRSVLEEDFYYGVSRAIFEAGQEAMALEHFARRWGQSEGEQLEQAFRRLTGLADDMPVNDAGQDHQSEVQLDEPALAADEDDPQPDAVPVQENVPESPELHVSHEADQEAVSVDASGATGAQPDVPAQQVLQVPEQSQRILIEPRRQGAAPKLREWKGLTAADLFAGFMEPGTNSYYDTLQYRSKQAFSALAAVENGEELTPNTRKALCRFMGWGGVADHFRTDHRKQHENVDGKDLAKSLGIERGQFNHHVISNRLESYYTPAPFIQKIWKGLEHLGVPENGRFLEPGCGAGYFFAGAPVGVQQAATLVGVECDEVAVRLAKAVAPDAVILPQRFERAVLDKSFDAVIGNVPFGETLISDRNYPAAKHIHDYFIVRGLDHLRPGGVMAVITSAGTMDKSNPSVRQQIYERADLLGAFRLPNTAFGEQGASVVTDILFLQRRPAGAVKGPDFTGTEELELAGHKFTINSYFSQNPDNVIGKFEVVSSAFGPKLAVTTATKSTAREAIVRIADQVGERILTLPQGAALRTEWEPDSDAATPVLPQKSPALEDLEGAVLLSDYRGFVGEFAIHEGRVIEVIDVMNEFDDSGVLVGERHVARNVELSPQQDAVLRGFIQIKEASRELLHAQLHANDDELAQVQSKVIELYNSFVGMYGPLNSPSNLRVYGDDAGSADVCALEIWDDENETVEALADITHSRILHQDAQGVIETAEDAFFHSLDRKGQVDFELMEEASGIDVETLKERLVGKLVFQNPVTGEYEPSAVYLSGNVVEKLREAREAVLTSDRYAINIQALEQVQPAPIPFEEISITIGASWMPPEDVRHFTAELFGISDLDELNFKVRHNPQVGLWTVDVSAAFKRNYEAHRTANWGNARLSYEQLLEKLLNSERPTHYDRGADDKMVVNDEATVLSREKQDEIARCFVEWVAKDGARAKRYADLYNAACNVFVVPKADGSHLTFPGLSTSWNPRKHQADFVALGLHGYNAMAAHCVGAGKTFEMVALAMKQKQLGMVTKPAIAVPNHMLGQIAREAKQMYPAARVLMVTQADLAGPARKRFLAIARNNNWDLVVMTHSLLNQLRASPDVMLAEHRAIVEGLQAHVGAAENKREERQLLAKLKTAMGRYEKLAAELKDEEKAGRMIRLNDLGIDCLHVDEAHLYRRLELASSMNVLGVTNSGSNRAFNLNALARELREHWGKAFGLFTYTGTPIANTMCEVYVHSKMLRPDLLEGAGIYNFDQWANRFGQVISVLEALPEGGGFKVSDRFARFVNLPEMVRAFRVVADVKTRKDLSLPVPEVDTRVVTVPQSEFQTAFMEHLAIRANKVRNREVEAYEDNMLAIASAGRKAALDLRLIEPTLPESASGKLAAVAQNMVELYNKTHEQKGTQLGFLDLGTPGKGKPFVAYEALRDLLMKGGIPKKEIAFIHEAKTHEAKEELFSRVREGAVRILIGSTEKMGVGTNVQTRLVALHDIDCPWNPAGIEQRRGRGERQGNQFFDKIYNFRYTTQDSFDLFVWETNKRKADFINQALADPDTAAREVSEAMDLGYAEVMAITTGDPRIREKVDVDEQVAKLERKHKAWLSEKASRALHADMFNRRIEAIDNEDEAMKRIGAAMPAGCKAHVTVEGSISGLQDGSTSWLYAKEIGLAVQARYSLLEARLMRMMDQKADLNMTIGDLKLHVFRVRSRLGSTDFEIGASIAGEAIPYNRIQVSKNATRIGRDLLDWKYLPQDRMDKNAAARQLSQRGLEQLNLNETTWPHVAELEALRAKKAELDLHFMSVAEKVAPSQDRFLMLLAEHRKAAYAQMGGGEQSSSDAPDLEETGLYEAEQLGHDDLMVINQANEKSTARPAGLR